MPDQPLFDFMKEDENDIHETMNREEDMDGNMLSVEDRLILGGVFLLQETSMTTLRLFLSQSQVNLYMESPSLVEKNKWQSLMERGWLMIGYHKDRRCCTNKMDFHLLKEIANASYFSGVLTRAEKALSEIDYVSYLRDFRSALYFSLGVMGVLRHDEEVFDRLEEIWKKKRITYYYIEENKDFRNDVLRFLAWHPEFIAELPSYSHDFQMTVFPECLWEGMMNAAPLLDWRKLGQYTPLAKEQRWALMTAAFIEADYEMLEQLAQTDETNTRVLYEAYLNTLHGDWKLADARFTRFFNSTDMMRYPQNAFTEMGGFFALLIACMSQGAETRIAKWVSSFFYSLRHIQQFSMLQQAAKDHRLGSYWTLPVSAPPLFHLVDALILAEVYSINPSHEALKMYKSYAFRFLDAKMQVPGFYMLSALAALLPNDSPDYQEIMARLQSSPVVPVINAETRITQWQNALEALADLADKTSTESVDTRRLGWILYTDKTMESGLHELRKIMPCLRGKGKNGKAAAWRVASTYALRIGNYNALLSKEEENIKHQVYHSYSYDSIDPENVVHLVNSDFVFLNDFDTPVHVVEEKNSIISTRNSKGETKLTLKYFFPYEGSGVLLDCTERGTVRFAVLDGKEDKLYKFFQKYEGKIIIPPEGREQLAETAAKISKTVPLSGVLMEEAYHDLRQVDGKTELHAFITAEANGYKVDFRCKPCSECDIFMLPGKGVEQRIMTIGEEKVLLKRHLKKEKEAFGKMLQECPSLPPLEEDGVDLMDVSEFLPALMEIKAAGFILDWRQGKPLKLMPQVGVPSLRLSCHQMADWFTIDGDLKVSEDLVISLQELLERLDGRNGSFIRLDDESYLQLTKDLLRKLEALKTASIPEKKQLRLSQAALPMLSTVFDNGLPKELEKQLERVKAAFATDIPMPRNFQGTLRPYQEDGVRYLARLADCRIGCCLADDMGLGKTIQLLALLLREARKGPALVVCPASLCRNWEREAIRFAPSLHTSILPQNNRKEHLDTMGEGDLLLCSYGILQSESELFEGVKWHVIILDEAQAIKNYTAKRTQSTKRLQADIRIASTGTPVENNLLELWSIFDFLNPGLLGRAKEFETRFCQDGMPLPALKRLVSPLIMRRKKSEVLDDLPPKTEIVIPVQLTEKELALYEVLRRNAMDKLQGEESASRIAILAELTRLRRFCCHPSLVDKAFGSPMEGAKLQRLMELVHELRDAGNRTLIFSQYVDFLHLIRNVFDKEQITYQYLDGSTPPAARMKAVDDFQNGQGDFFLISLKAGGTGLNLTAASYVILTDPWWNPAVEQQAADRVHRIGQQQPVTIYRMISSDTVEEKVLELHARKKMSSEEILSETESTTVTVEELMSLFGHSEA